MATLSVQRGILEHLFGMLLRSDTHIFLAQVLDMSIDVGILELLREGNLLERHAMDASRSGTEQRSCGKDGSLHNRNKWLMGVKMMMDGWKRVMIFGLGREEGWRR